MTEQAIQNAMKTLELTREEAIEMLQEDEEIDHGADPHPLTPEQEKASKAVRIVSTGPRKTPVKRERKPNKEKQDLIQYLALCLHSNDTVDSWEIINHERQIDFTCGNTKYRIVLSAPRK